MAGCQATADTKPIEKKIHDQSEIALSLRSARAARDRIVNLLLEYIIIIFIIIIKIICLFRKPYVDYHIININEED